MANATVRRVQYLDGVRGIAIGLVVLVHWVNPRFQHFPGGYVGVGLFFVLSGYIITTLLWRKPPASVPNAYGRFLWRRVKRLYPALIAVVVVALVAANLLGQSTTGLVGVRDGVFALLQLGAICRGLGLDPMPLFGQTWSLSVEWAFYLVWPVVVLIARKRRVGSLLLGQITLSVAVVYYVLLEFVASPTWFYYGLGGGCVQLLVGSGLALTVRSASPRSPGRSRWIVILVPVAFVVLLGWTIGGSLPEDAAYMRLGFPLTTAAAAVLILSGVLAPEVKILRLLEMRWLTALGRASYSLYLWHVLPLQLLSDHMHIPLAILALGGAGFVIVATVLSYEFLEKRFMKPRGNAFPQSDLVEKLAEITSNDEV